MASAWALKAGADYLRRSPDGAFAACSLDKAAVFPEGSLAKARAAASEASASLGREARVVELLITERELEEGR